MAQATPNLDWCIVRLGKDMNWWVEEISDEIHWDVDGLGILDPRQFSHITDLLEPLQAYDFDPQIVENAFYGFTIDKELKKERVRLTRSNTSLLDSGELLFALPDVIDEEKGPYADFLTHITRLRVRLLNDLIDFNEALTVEELEEEIRDRQNADFLEGRATHFFQEITSILEYVPEGFELDVAEESSSRNSESAVADELADIEGAEEETLEEDDTMRWDDGEEREEVEASEEDRL